MTGPGGSDDPSADEATSLVVLSEPTPEDIVALEDRLYGNVAATGVDDGRYLSIFLKRDDETIYAGLHGHSWAGVCEIKTLWIADSERGKGLGSRLLAEAEQEARRRGCHVIHLSSFTFQAPDFYEKHGFQRLVQLEDFPRGHANVLLAKMLVPVPPI
ncbi:MULTISPECIES: GNAT family N-acetyltransferase [Mesorhizobium]|uniref:GNAT family N-acetyltransferase n=1 Tax=Mesorhizobium TaxID=68287 RepID=UPI0010A96C2B|nr:MULTISPECIES: GNAT family N-acetyltransferase [Mesorhizobium]